MAVWTRPLQDWDGLASDIAASQGPVTWAWTAERHDGRWRLGTLTIRSGVALAEGIHRYPEAVIAVESLTPKTAARRFRRGIVATKGVIAGGLAISPVGGDTGGVRLTSDQAYGTSGPGWPRIWVGLNPNDMFEPDPRAVLLA